MTHALLVLLVLTLAVVWATHANAAVQVVVARYAEDLSWLAELPYTDVIVYDKGTTPHNAPPHVKVRKLPNVGKCDHTYLHHLHTHYDRLADVTVFLPASVAADRGKSIKMRQVLDEVRNTGGSSFPVADVFERPLHVEMADFKLDQWKTSDKTNASMNAESDLLPCPDRPFGKWYAKNFRGVAVHSVWYQAIFAVTREHAHNTSRQGYKRLLSYVDHHSNPEAGHYIERSWAAIFKVHHVR